MDASTRSYFIYLTLAEVARHFLLPMLPILYFHPTWLWPESVSFATQAWALGVGLALLKGGGMLSCVLAYHVLPRFGAKLGGLLSHISIFLVAVFGWLALHQQQVLWLQVGLFIHGVLFCGEVSGLSFAQMQSTKPKVQLKRLAIFQSYWCFGAMLGPLFVVCFLPGSDWVQYLWWALLIWGALGTLWGGVTILPNLTYLPGRLDGVFAGLSWKKLYPLCVLLWWVQAAWAMFYQFSPGFLRGYAQLDHRAVGLSIAMMSVVLVTTSGWLLPRLSRICSSDALVAKALVLLPLSGLVGLLGWVLSWPLWVVWACSGVLMAMGDVMLFVLLLRQLIEVSGRRGIEIICLVFLSCLVIWMVCGLIGGYGFGKDPLFIWYWVLLQSIGALMWYHLKVR